MPVTVIPNPGTAPSKLDHDGIGRLHSANGGEIFRTCLDRPWGPPSLLYNGYRVFPGDKERPGRDADPSPLSSAVGHERVELYLLPLWAVRPVQSLSACTRVHFTFTFCKCSLLFSLKICINPHVFQNNKDIALCI